MVERSARAADATTPLRVAMMVSGSGVNGAVVHALILTRYLLRRGHRVLLLHRPDAWISRQPDLEQAELLATSFGRWPRELIRVTRRLNRFGAQLVHTHMSSAHSYGLLTRLLSRRPVVATAHAQYVQLHWCFNHLVIATSAAAAEFHRRRNRVARSALRVQANFIETKGFPRPTEDERRAARAELGLADDAFVVGSVGFVDERKRQLDLVRALGSVAPAVPQARLLLVGGEHAAYGREIRRAAEQLGVAGSVVLTGNRDDVRHLLAALDVYALVSRDESGPLSVLEAMSTGLPVLATNVGMLPEFVRDGVAGHVVEVGDVASIADRLRLLAADRERRAAMGRAAHAIARSDYDVAVGGPRVEAILVEAAQLESRPLLGFVAGLCGAA